ncbi:CRAL-TRIO domain-containing protein [Pelagophyceae sp. CCMP2097]|nr:CRAL-TRIO domain-containing protein [Pelagophyceae sp. CCMP2097]
MPAWVGGFAKDGEHVYWERPGHVDVGMLKDAGVTMEALVRHYIFVCEWTWQVLSPSRTDAASWQFVVLDVDGVRLSQVGGTRLEYLRICSDLASKHYPLRTKKYIVVNAPTWFAAAWRVIKPLVHADAAKNVIVARAGEATTKALLEYIDAEHVPACYGGKYAPGESIDEARKKTPEELACRAYVRRNVSENISPDASSTPVKPPPPSSVRARSPPSLRAKSPPPRPPLPPQQSLRARSPPLQQPLAARSLSMPASGSPAIDDAPPQ